MDDPRCRQKKDDDSQGAKKPAKLRFTRTDLFVVSQIMSKAELYKYDDMIMNLVMRWK